MKKVTIIGWHSGEQEVVEEVTHWPSVVSDYLAVAKASREANVSIIEQVLVEEAEWTTDHKTDNS